MARNTWPWQGKRLRPRRRAGLPRLQRAERFRGFDVGDFRALGDRVAFAEVPGGEQINLGLTDSIVDCGTLSALRFHGVEIGFGFWNRACEGGTAFPMRRGA